MFNVGGCDIASPFISPPPPLRPCICVVCLSRRLFVSVTLRVRRSVVVLVSVCLCLSLALCVCKQLGAQVEELRENVQEALDTLDSIKDPPGNATDERENRDDSADAQQRGKLEDGASGGGKARRGRGAAEGDGVADAEDPGKGVNSGGGTGVGGQRLEVGGSGSGKGTPGTCISCEAVWW